MKTRFNKSQATMPGKKTIASSNVNQMPIPIIRYLLLGVLLMGYFQSQAISFYPCKVNLSSWETISFQMENPSSSIGSVPVVLSSCLGATPDICIEAEVLADGKTLLIRVRRTQEEQLSVGQDLAIVYVPDDTGKIVAKYRLVSGGTGVTQVIDIF